MIAHKQPSSPDQIMVFDRALVRRHRDRAATGFEKHRALFEVSADMLIERIDDVTRDFAAVLDLGAHDGVLASRLGQDGFIVASDLSERLLKTYAGPVVVADEEFLPFGENSFDLIVSNLSLHWVNDLPGALWQIRRALRPGGLFLAAVLGGDSLHELRHCLTDAELMLRGGISPHVSPTISLIAATGLMQRAGFALPVVDHEICNLTYPDMRGLMHDLRGMGEGNAHQQRSRQPAGRDVFTAAASLYAERYKTLSDRGEGITATFDIIFLHGWKD